MTQRTRSANLGGTVITSTGVVLASGLDVSNQSNAAYLQANTARDTANSAFDQANAAYLQANTARSDSNTTFATVNSTFGAVNTAVTNAHNQANAAYSQANTATTTGQNAYAQANLAYAAANNSNLLSGGLVSGTINVTQDLIVGGNIYLEGNTTYINVATYSIEDSLVYYASNNKLTDSVDIGFMGGKNTSGTYSHTGLARDATDGKWKLFDGLADEGHIGNVVDFANTTIATLVANVEANSITVLGNRVAVNTEVAAAYNQANSAFTAANNRVLKAGDTMTGSLVLGAGRTVGNGGIFLSHTGLNTDVFANGRTASVSTGWGTFRIHQEKGNPGLIIAGDASQTAPYVRIQNNAESALVVVDSAGNIGVGAASPSEKLHVVGNLLTTSGSVRIYDSGGGEGGEILLYNPGAPSASPGVGLVIDVSSNNNGRIFSVANNSALQIGQLGGTGGIIDLYTAGSIRARIDGSGNIGVGTASPGAKLDVSAGNVVLSGSSTADQFIRIGSGRTGNGFSYLDLQGDSTYSNGLRLIRLNAGPNSGSSIESRGTGALQFVTQEAAPIDFYTNGANLRLKIDSSGNVGVGTATPSSYGRFAVVAGNTYFYVASSGFWSSVFGPRSAGDGFCSVGMYYNNSGGYWKMDSASGAFTFYENGTLRASISNAGQLQSYATTGTAPLVISSTTAVANLNADLLDGYQGSSFVQRTNSGDQATLWDPYGQYYTAVWGVGNDYNNFINSGSYHVDNAATNRPEATYGFLRVWRHIGSNYALQEFTSSSTPVTTWRRLAQDNGSGGRIWTGWAKYWSDGNDGSGSGLDADLLDGVQGSSFLRSDQSATNSVDLRAPNFYISADTSNRFGQGVLIIRNAAPTIYFQDTDHNSGMWHCNASLMYLLRGGNDTTSWSQVSGQWPFIFNLANNDATCGGNFAAVGNVTAYSSDRRLKINIQNIPNALDKVLSLNGVTFDWVDRVKELGFTPDTMINDAGVIAQEVQEVLPQAVKPAPFDREWNVDKSTTISKSGEDFITVQYEKLVPLLIEAIKELKAEIDTLKQRG